MSASVLAGNSALGLSAAPPRAGGAKAATSEASGESAFQLAVGSAGEEGRRSAERQTALASEGLDEGMQRPAQGDEPGQRLHRWMSGLDSHPAAGDLLLSGGAVTPENGAPVVMKDDGAANLQETVEPDVLASVEQDVRELVAIAVRNDESAETQEAAQAAETTEVPEATSRVTADPALNGTDEEGAPDLDRGSDQAPNTGQKVEANSSVVTDADGLAVANDLVDQPTPAESTVAETSKPVPATDMKPAQTVSTTVSLLTQPQYHPADARVADNAVPSAPKLEQTQLHPYEALRSENVAMEPVATARPALEAPSTGKPDGSGETRNSQPLTAPPANQPNAPTVAQTAAMMPKPLTGGSKVDFARDTERGVERSDFNLRVGAVRDAEMLDRPRVEGADRHQPAKIVSSEQRPTPADPSLPVVASARDATPAHSAAPQIQPATVTVVESRQYLGVAPQQANAEAIAKAVSGNEAWSAALRNETTVQTSAPLQTLKIRLNPAELGMVDATLRLSGDKLVVELNVQTTEAYRQLSDNRQSVLNALRGQGYGVETLSVQLSPSDRSGQQGTSTGQHQGGFDGQPSQDNFRQSGEGGRFGQENRNDDGHRSNVNGSGETSADGSAVAPGSSDGAVYL